MGGYLLWRETFAMALWKKSCEKYYISFHMANEGTKASYKKESLFNGGVWISGMRSQSHM